MRLLTRTNNLTTVVALLAFSMSLGAQQGTATEAEGGELEAGNAASFSLSGQNNSPSTGLPLAVSGTWTLTGKLHNARDGHTATLLQNGIVLVAGGENNNITLGTSELFNPATGTWTVTGSLNIDRASAQAVLLASGKVLVVGGCTSNCLDATATAELYDPVAGTWSLTGSLGTARTFFSLTMLQNDQVLAAGGCTTLNSTGCTAITSTAEIYNPSTGAWSPTGSLVAARMSHTGTLISSGAVVLAAGGANAAGDAFSSSELYNTVTGVWSVAGKMNTAHSEHTATLLSSGLLIVAGGENVHGFSGARTELYDPTANKWTFTGNLNVPRQEHTAVLLPNGNVLVAGGTRAVSTGSFILSSAELYNPGTGLWTKTGAMNAARTGHTATLLNTGLVLAASGSGANTDLLSAELYTP